MSPKLLSLKAKLDRLSAKERAELAQYLSNSLASGRKRHTTSAKRKLAQITPPNARLRKLARESPPPVEWFQQDEPRPF